MDLDVDALALVDEPVDALDATIPGSPRYLDVCRALRVVDVAFAKGGKAILVRVVAMLTKMCR